MSAPTLGDAWRGELSKLGEGWDGYDGKPITSSAIHTVESFAVVPMGSGGVQLEIHRDGFDIEICIGADGSIESALIVALNGSTNSKGETKWITNQL